MGAIAESPVFVDVICEHTSKGELIPLRMRVKDEDGIYQTFSIKSYKEISVPGTYQTPYGTLMHSNTWRFLCKIQVLSFSKTVELLFNTNDNLWRMVNVS